MNIVRRIAAPSLLVALATFACDDQPIAPPVTVLKWSYFVGQSEGKAKVDSDWFWEPSGAFALFCLEWDSTVCGPLGQREGRMPG